MADYYSTCPFPKPSSSKKKKKVNGYKDKPNRICFYCKTPGAERHEVFGGTGNRQISIDNGFQVDLCSTCHREFTENTEWGMRESRKWKRYYQRKWENELLAGGMDKFKVRDLWITMIGRSYLDVID